MPFVCIFLGKSMGMRKRTPLHRPRFPGAVFPLTFLLLVIAFLGACAPVTRVPGGGKSMIGIEADKQREMAISQYIVNKTKLHQTAYRILWANADLCGRRTAAGVGMSFINGYEFGGDFRKVAYSRFGIGKALKVLAVAEGSGAFKAGVRKADTLISINGWNVPYGKDATEETLQKFQDLARGNQPYQAVMSRNSANYRLSFRPEKICDFGYDIEMGDTVNAAADGNNIVISEGMMRFINDEIEMATVVGHEIAHNLMGHISKTKGNIALGTTADFFLAVIGINTGGAGAEAGSRAYSQGFESEADYVGLYLMARAGYPVINAPYFWRRMAIRAPQNIRTNSAASHPAPPARFVSMDRTVSEIQAKQQAGQRLYPERR